MSVLSDWLDSDGILMLGANGNAWLSVVEHGGAQMRRSTVQAEREAYRSVTLKTLRLAQEHGALPTYECVVREMRLRVAFLCTLPATSEWARSEAVAISRLFLVNIPIDLHEARLAIRELQQTGLDSFPLARLRDLRRTKNMLGALRSLNEYHQR